MHDWDDEAAGDAMRRAVTRQRCHDWAPRGAQGWSHCRTCPARCQRSREGRIDVFEADIAKWPLPISTPWRDGR